MEFLDKTFDLKDIPKYQIRRLSYFYSSKEVRGPPDTSQGGRGRLLFGL